MASPLPLEIVMLLEHRKERDHFMQEARVLEMRLYATDDPAEVLSYVIHRKPDAVVLPIGRREEESVLLCRSIRKRIGRDLLLILFVNYGGSLVESVQEAHDMGADRLLPRNTPKNLLEQVRSAVELPMDISVNDSEIIDMAWSTDGVAIEEADSAAQVGPDESVRDREPDFRPGAGTLVLSSLSDPRGSMRRRLEHLYSKLRDVREADYFVVLGVSREASGGELYEAFLELNQRFDRESWPDDNYNTLGGELEEIREALMDAWNVLGNAFLRARYRSSLT